MENKVTACNFSAELPNSLSLFSHLRIPEDLGHAHGTLGRHDRVVHRAKNKGGRGIIPHMFYNRVVLRQIKCLFSRQTRAKEVDLGGETRCAVLHRDDGTDKQTKVRPRTVCVWSYFIMLWTRDTCSMGLISAI